MRWRAARPPRPFKEGSRYLQGRFKEGSMGRSQEQDARAHPPSSTPRPPSSHRPLHGAADGTGFTPSSTPRTRSHARTAHSREGPTRGRGLDLDAISISTRSRPDLPTPPPRPARNLPTISRRTRGANSWNAPPLLARSRPRPREITARDCDLGLARLRLRLTPRLTPRACP